MSHFYFGPDEWPERSLFRGSGSMAYPEGEMRYIWDGRGTRGPAADCLITRDEIRLRPKKAIRTLLGWPELVLPPEEIRAVERLFFGDYRFRSKESRLLDGACFQPIGSKRAFLAALEELGVPIINVSLSDKLAFELRTAWNSVRWGGRKRRRHWKGEQQEAA